MSEGICETVEVQRAKTPANPSGVVIINKSDLTDKEVLVGVGYEPAPAPALAKVPLSKVAEVAPPAPAPWAKPTE